MKALAAIVLASTLTLGIPAPAFAARIALYRAGFAVVSPGSLENPGTYGLGYGFNLGVTVPFMHRTGVTLDVAHDRLRWEDGSEVTIGGSPIERDDLTVTSVMLGADVAFRRGHPARPLLTLGAGVARVGPGAAVIRDINGPLTDEPDGETVFAAAASAGLRIRGPWWPGALRMTLGWTGLARDEFAHVVPLRVQVEF